MPDIASKADAIYFLMFPGWEDELRSNRWHYATRWAKHLPVILVQESPLENWGTEKEERIENCRILRVRRASDSMSDTAEYSHQADQIKKDIKDHGYKHVILWMYNPNYVLAWKIIPAVARIYHATENHFQFSNISKYFEARLKWSLESADAVICCSDGVRKTYSQYTDGMITTISNGCEYFFYASGEPDPELVAKSNCYEKTVVYAGNINDRLDLKLLLKLASKYQKMALVFFGKSHFTKYKNKRIWKKITALNNVYFFGYVDPSRLPHIYAAADVGILPYLPIPYLKNNGLPLKAFEMVAAGLPIVVAHLDMMRPYECEGIIVVDDEGFIDAVRDLSREELSEAAKMELSIISKVHDYDNKFSSAFEITEKILNARQIPMAYPAGELGVLLNKNPTYIDSTVKDSASINNANSISYTIPRFIVAAICPLLMLLYRRVWPMLSHKIRQKLRNKYYNFVVNVLKL